MNKDKKKTLKLIISLVFVSWLPVMYNNCSTHDEGSDQATNSSFKSCEGADQLSLFSRTYHPFVKNRCNNCHQGGGAGPGAFASSSPQDAFDSFVKIGQSRVAERALDGHSSTSGPQNQTTIGELQIAWGEGIDFMRACQNELEADLLEDQDTPDRIQTRSKAIGFANEGDRPFENSTTITWDLSSSADISMNDLNSPSDPTKQFKHEDFLNPDTLCRQVDFGEVQDNCNAKLKVDVNLFFTGTNLVYIVSRPRVETYGVDQNIHIESLLFKINGKANPAQRAFFFSNRDVRAWNSVHPFHVNHPDFDLVVPGGSVAGDLAKYRERQRENFMISDSSLFVDIDEVRSTDVISVSIGKLYKTWLPDIAGLPVVKISATGSGSLYNSGGSLDANGKVLKLAREDNIPDPATCTPQPECAKSPGPFTEFQVNVSLEIPDGFDFNEVASVDIEYGDETSNNFVEECCSATINFEGNDISHDYFNRDTEQINATGVRSRPFKVFDDNDDGDNGVRWHLTFLPGETEKIIRLRVVPDDRYERETQFAGDWGEQVQFSLRNPSLARIEKSDDTFINDKFKVFIPDNDVVPANIFLTYSILMKSGGVLRDQCVRCHNSQDARGGYDMTNYWQMVEEGILKRGGGALSYDSIMFQRMNPTSNSSTVLNLQSMPPGEGGGNSFLEFNEREDVAKWLQENKAHND